MFCNILISIRILCEITGLELYIGTGCLFIGYMTERKWLLLLQNLLAFNTSLWRGKNMMPFPNPLMVYQLSSV